MPGNRTIPVLVVVATLLLAGCVAPTTGGSNRSGPAPRSYTGASGPTPPPPSPRGSSVVQNLSSADGSGTTYERLYNATANSVVLIRAITPSAVATGSGFVYDRGGDIVTNQHVVADAQHVEVQLHDGTWENATVVGSDAYSDLAVIRIPHLPSTAQPLPVARSWPRVGEPVAAIGNPFGLSGSITTGIVSGVNRTMPTQGSFTIPGTVQTDAAINPGNSGGPLLTPQGVVVGVNRATQGVNVGFAVSAVVLRTVVPRLISQGSFAHAYLGVATDEVNPEVARANNLTNATGVLVVKDLQGGPAQGHLDPSTHTTSEDGLQVPVGGDDIVGFNGTPVTNEEQLALDLLIHAHPGETVPLTVLRNGTETQVNVTLGTRPAG